MKVFLLAVLCVAVISAVPLQKKVGNRRIGGGRIINGEQASEGQFPWQVAIYFETDFGTAFCGGSLISDQWILTAAHCAVETPDPADFTVYAGVTALSDAANPLVVAQAIPHADYDDWTLENDVALLQLASPVVLSDTVQPVNLATEALADGSSATVSGWGLTSDSSSELSPVLNYVGLTTITNSECDTFYGDGTTTEGIVCAGAGDPVKSTCSGDSGGPLVSDPDSAPVQVGVVSFGSIMGCESGYPSGYSRVAYFRDWITQNSGV